MNHKMRWGSLSGAAVMGAIAMLTAAAVRRLLRRQQQTPLDETPDPELEREAQRVSGTTGPAPEDSASGGE